MSDAPLAFTPVELARRLRVSRTRVMGWIRSGALRAVNLADGDRPRFRITTDALDQFLDSRTVKPVAAKSRSRRVPDQVVREAWY